MQFGRQTDTGDADGQITLDQPLKELNQDQLMTALTSLEGSRDQMVPAYAAVKVNGQKLYQLARAGKPLLDRPIRHITIQNLKLKALDAHDQYPRAVVEVDCSKGTYIRVLAEEIAAKLGTIAHLTALQRTASGQYTLDQAITVEELQQSSHPEQFLRQLAI
jgi:tRNA pseudouridine55 synthase